VHIRGQTQSIRSRGVAQLILPHFQFNWELQFDFLLMPPFVPLLLFPYLRFTTASIDELSTHFFREDGGMEIKCGPTRRKVGGGMRMLFDEMIVVLRTAKSGTGLT